MSRISDILFLFFKWFLSSPNKGWCCYICLAKKWCRIYMGRHRIKSVVETQTRWEIFLQNNLTTKYAHQFPRLQTWILRNVCIFFCFSLKRKNFSGWWRWWKISYIIEVYNFKESSTEKFQTYIPNWKIKEPNPDF